MDSKKRKQNDFVALVPETVEGLPKLSYKSELDIFDSIPSIQSVIEEKETVKIPPVTALMANSHLIDFVIPGFTNYVYNPSSLRLNLKLSILKNDRPVGPCRKGKGDNVQTEAEQIYDPVSVINNIGSSMFARVMISLNDVEVFSSNGLHSYRSWIEQSLAFSSDNKYALTRSTQGYVRDSGDDPASVDFQENVGPFVRSEWTSNGKVLHLLSKLSHDCLNTGGKVLPPGTTMRLRLERASDVFCLMWDKNNSPASYENDPPKYNLSIQSIYVEIDRFKLEQPAIDYLSNKLSRQTARYYLTRVEMREQFIPMNTIEWTNELIFGLQFVPLRLFFGLCPVVNKNGTYTTNPLCFLPNHLEEISIKINEKIIQVIKIRNWDGSEMLEAYTQLLKALHVLDKPSEIDITMEDWAGGPLTLFGVDLSKDGSGASDPVPGAVSICLRFRNPTSENLTAIIYGCYQGSLFIRNDKTIECYDSVVVEPAKRE